MKVALVVERFRPGAGGVENVAWRVAHGLAADGIDVHVLAREASPDAKVPVRTLAVPRAWQPLRVLAFSRAAAAAAAAGGFDVVHSFTRTLHQDVYRAGGGSHADYLARRPAALGQTGHADSPARRSGALDRAGRTLRRASPRHATLLWIEARVFADARQLIQCNSEMVRSELRRRHGVPDERLVVLRNPVDTERFSPRRRASLDAPGPVWLFVGTGFPRKGLDTALRALAAARAPDAALWVAGRDAPAPWQALADRLGVGGRVRFLGPRADLETLYASADALLLPTRYDAFANVCLEAAASGIPVVTSGANGAAELVRPARPARPEGPAAPAGAAPAAPEEAAPGDRPGLVVEDPEDVAGFARALDALTVPAARARMGRAARAVAEHHSLAAHVAGLRALYARVHR